jgi:FMN-dependent NADH-azoreductase
VKVNESVPTEVFIQPGEPMSKLLCIDVSPRGDYSTSRKLADAVVAHWKQKNPGSEVITRDVSKGLPIVDLPWIAGAYSTPDQHTPEHKAALKLSDELIAELLSATEILIATPMWNFTLPAALRQLLVRKDVLQSLFA